MPVSNSISKPVETAHRPTRRSHPMRLALICDFLEEGWPSMDLFGDMLFQYFRRDHASTLEAEQLRPALRRRFSKFPGFGRAGVCWKADRLLNRFYDYPAWLKKRAGAFDLYHLVDHSYSQLLLELAAARTVVTCHDLDTFKCLLEPKSEPRPPWFRAMAQRSFDGFLSAAQVICVSAFTRGEILRHGLFPPERLTTIAPGVDPAYFGELEPGFEEETLHRIGMTGQRWLLHVGSTIRRKRIDVLLRIFAQVAAKFPDLKLLRVGGPFNSEQEQLAARLGISNRITVAPRLSKKQLAAVYRRAALLVQPSGAEGFGLPVVEAMASGCVVLASDIEPLREAGGAAADYCPVGDIEAWSETVIRLVSERATSPEAWEARRTRARQHAGGYTWIENAKQTITVYERLLGRDVSGPHGRN